MPSIQIAGQTVLFDEQDRAVVESIDWNISSNLQHRYVQKNQRGSDGKSHCIRLHRLIMGAPDGLVVDHINGDSLDNRRVNLRVCTHAENMRNRKIHKNNRSGFKGVYFDPGCPKRPWRAEIKVAKQRKRLGFYSTPEEAHRAYVLAAKELHGEFARAS